MEGLPQFSVLQKHPDIALEIGIRSRSYVGRRRPAEVGLQVWKKNTNKHFLLEKLVEEDTCVLTEAKLILRSSHQLTSDGLHPLD